MEHRWLEKAKRAEDDLALAYPPCVIDEIADSFFTAPLLSIDETVLRAFPVDPFDVARTRRRSTLSPLLAEQMVAEPLAAVAPSAAVLAPALMTGAARLSAKPARVSRGWGAGLLMAAAGLIFGATLVYAGMNRSAAVRPPSALAQ